MSNVRNASISLPTLANEYNPKLDFFFSISKSRSDNRLMSWYCCETTSLNRSMVSNDLSYRFFVACIESFNWTNCCSNSKTRCCNRSSFLMIFATSIVFSFDNTVVSFSIITSCDNINCGKIINIKMRIFFIIFDLLHQTIAV